MAKNMTELTPQSVAKEIISELRKHNLIKDNKSTFQKTEVLLYNYNNFKKTIENKYRQIDTIMVAGSNKKSSSVIFFSNNNNMETALESEKIEEQILRIEQSITTTKAFVQMIDDAVNKLKDDKYYDIIILKYFEGKSREEIAEFFDCDIRTITRNKNRLINRLKIDLFSDDAIIEMLI